MAPTTRQIKTARKAVLTSTGAVSYAAAAPIFVPYEMHTYRYHMVTGFVPCDVHTYR